jgi:hypothetical protein
VTELFAGLRAGSLVDLRQNRRMGRQISEMLTH